MQEPLAAGGGGRRTGSQTKQITKKRRLFFPSGRSAPRPRAREGPRTPVRGAEEAPHFSPAPRGAGGAERGVS